MPNQQNEPRARQTDPFIAACPPPIGDRTAPACSGKRHRMNQEHQGDNKPKKEGPGLPTVRHIGGEDKHNDGPDQELPGGSP